ncbi:MAG TPA: DUF1844 domain-containing protein [Blastocatellia bacterium]|nr:DUF1844 domain-containing protein [Blastocatellia bacterium]
MSEQKESNFKVSDRRKFNPDGTLREPSEETAEAARQAPAPPQQADTGASANVVSFPGAAEPAPTPAPKREEPKPPTPGPTSAAEQAYHQASRSQPSQMPAATFANFINMLAVEAAMHLGLIETPEGPTAVDLDAARHMIDTLGMLEQKTQGNLTPEESNLLTRMLADLRMQYVALSRRR